MININTFKHLCMCTRSKRGKEIREYYMEIEKMLMKYKNILIENLEKKSTHQNWSIND